jgi:hypothetical protein
MMPFTSHRANACHTVARALAGRHPTWAEVITVYRRMVKKELS